MCFYGRTRVRTTARDLARRGVSALGARDTSALGVHSHCASASDIEIVQRITLLA
jgi:hypothetical protein